MAKTYNYLDSAGLQRFFDNLKVYYLNTDEVRVGYASKANSLATARDFKVSGDIISSEAVSFNGTGDVNIEITIADATTTKHGLMTAADKAKLDGIAAGAQVNVQSDWTATEGDGFIKNKPTKVSDFTNDAGFITNTVADLANYYNKTQTYTQTEIDERIAAIKTGAFKVVDVLPSPTVECTGYIYLVPKAGAETQNIKDEYICVKTSVEGVTPAVYAWEKIGDTEVDLSDYRTAAEQDGIDDGIKGLITDVAGDLQAEATTRATEDGKLDQKITNVGTALSNEVTRATTAEGSLSTAISTETTNRENADTTINNKIDALYKVDGSGNPQGTIATRLAAIEAGTAGFETTITAGSTSTKGAQTQAIVKYIDADHKAIINTTEETGEVIDWVKDQGYVTSSGVTSIGLSMPLGTFDVEDSPITTAGTIKTTWKTQGANLIFAGPADRSTQLNATPAFRKLVSADIAEAGILTNNTSGNAATADNFKAVKEVNLTGAVTGGAFGGVSGGWEIATTLADAAVTNVKLAGGITNDKFVNDSVIIGDTEVDLGETVTEITGLTAIEAETFTGDLIGNASSATKADNDGNNNNIIATYATKAELENIKAAFTVKASVATKSELPTSGNENGDVRCVEDEGVNYVWSTDGWVKFSSSYSAATASQLGLVSVGNNITNSAGHISITKNNVESALGYIPLEKVQVNGEEVLISNRTVNIPVPTDYVTEEDVLADINNENVTTAIGYIPLEGVKVNGTDLVVTNHKVNVDLTDYPTEEEVDQKIAESVTSIYNFRGSVERYEDLPIGAAQGDVYNVVTETVIGGKTYQAGTNFAWDGMEWDALGGAMDLTKFYTKEQADELYAGKSDVGHNHDDRYYTKNGMDTTLAGYVEKVSGKGLSTNDYTTADKNLVAMVPNKLDTTTADSTYYKIIDATTALAAKADLVEGKVPANQLPSFVDDVLEFANVSAFPATGEAGKIYVALDTNKTYRWSGTQYIEISASLALGTTASTAWYGDRGLATETGLSTHIADKNNPHEVTKVQVGLGNLTNDRQIKGLESGTTAGNLVVWGSNGYTVVDGSVAVKTTLTDTLDTDIPTSKAVGTYVKAKIDALDTGVSDVTMDGTSIVVNGVAALDTTLENYVLHTELGVISNSAIDQMFGLSV